MAEMVWLSVCCDALPLTEMDDLKTGRCGDCKDNTTFEEVEDPN